MELFVIRHAPAVPRRPLLDDAARPLTDEGRQSWRRSVRGLDRLGIQFDRVYHSPWLRAVETANELAPVAEGEMTVTGELARRPRAALFDVARGKAVALVGHEPWLSELLGVVLLGETARAHPFVLKKGSVAWLEGDFGPGKMSLKALLTPRVLRALGK